MVERTCKTARQKGVKIEENTSIIHVELKDAQNVMTISLMNGALLSLPFMGFQNFTEKIPQNCISMWQKGILVIWVKT